MNCYRCGKEMRNIIGGCYICDNCGFGIDDLVYRQPICEPEKHCYQQGWVCPKCGGVYSPSQGCCPNCTPARPLQFTCDTGKPAFDRFTTTTGTTSQEWKTIQEWETMRKNKKRKGE